MILDKSKSNQHLNNMKTRTQYVRVFVQSENANVNVNGHESANTIANTSPKTETKTVHKHDHFVRVTQKQERTLEAEFRWNVTYKTMSTTKAQTAKEICEAFEHPASSFKINKVHPTKTELQEAFRKVEANAIGNMCGARMWRIWMVNNDCKRDWVEELSRRAADGKQ